MAFEITKWRRLSFIASICTVFAFYLSISMPLLVSLVDTNIILITSGLMLAAFFVIYSTIVKLFHFYSSRILTVTTILVAFFALRVHVSNIVINVLLKLGCKYEVHDNGVLSILYLLVLVLWFVLLLTDRKTCRQVINPIRYFAVGLLVSCIAGFLMLFFVYPMFDGMSLFTGISFLILLKLVRLPAVS